MARDPLDDFERTTHDFLGETRTVFVAGDGPPILVLAEMPGITPSVAAFARRLVAEGYSVYMPHLFGDPGAPISAGAFLKAIGPACVSRQFAALATGVTAPVTHWLRDLMRRAVAERDAPGAGVIGMCFTGGFALGMLMDPELLAPVLSQPSLPLGLTAKHRADLGLDAGDLKDVKRRVESEDIEILGMRFTGDKLCPGVRFDTLSETFGDKFIRVEIDSSPGNAFGIRKAAHSVVTEDLVDEPGHPTHDALVQMLAFFDDKLRASAN